MCQYWKKLHTCTHLSDRPYIEMCRPGYLSNTVCADISETSDPRPSHFPCYPCIKASAHLEAQEKHLAARAHDAASEKAAELRRKEERVRREAREKAERERVAEGKARREREEAAERARREGGVWMLAEAGSARKKRGGKVGAGPVSPGKKGKENEKGEVGRAGVWGPKKILSRKEGAGVLGAVNGVGGVNGVNGVDGVKK